MKNIFKLILPIFFIGLMSCDEEGKEIIQASLLDAPVLHAVEDGANLNPETPNNQALTIVWDDANYGANTQVNYDVQVSNMSNFEEFETITTTTDRLYFWNVTNLNVYALNAGLSANEEGMLYFRIKSSIGDPETLVAYSNIISVTMMPFASYTFKDFYLVGNGTSAGWNADNNNMPLFRSANNENYYSFTGFFAKADDTDDEGRFKLLEQIGAWQPQWGDARPEGEDPVALSGDVAGNPGTQANDPGRFGVPAEGYYTFNIDFASLTYTIEEFDVSSATVYESMGLIGDATSGGWETETAMTQSDFDPHKWYLLDFELGNGGVKFRANGSWDFNWGSANAYSGVGTPGGDNIPVTSGVYDVWFNDLTGEYMLIPQE